MALDFTPLTNEVAAYDAVDVSVLALIDGMAAQIVALKNSVSDPAAQAAIQDFADRFKAQREKLAAAVTANTDQAVPPVPGTPEAAAAAQRAQQMR
jgi:phosphoheptose isomerase